MLGLEIRNPNQSDRGIYRCQALNTFGNSNAHITLNFQGTYKLLVTASIIYYVTMSCNIVKFLKRSFCQGKGMGKGSKEN